MSDTKPSAETMDYGGISELRTAIGFSLSVIEEALTRRGDGRYVVLGPRDATPNAGTRETAAMELD